MPPPGPLRGKSDHNSVLRERGVDPRSLFELGDSPVPQTPRSRGVDPRSLLEPGLRSPDLAPGSPSCEVYNGRVRASRPRLFVALDAASVSGRAVAPSGD